PDQRRQVGLVDDEQVGAGNARPALSGNLVAGRNVDDVERQVGELRAEGRGQIVAAGLDEAELRLWKPRNHPIDSRQVDRGILPDRRVRAAAGLDPLNALRFQYARAGEDQLVFARIDVVGDCEDVVARAHRLAEGFEQRRLAGPDRPADPDAKRPRRRSPTAVPRRVDLDDAHDRNNLVYCVSCFIDAQSTIGVALPMSASEAVSAARAASITGGSSIARMCSPSDCPNGTSRTAAETRLAANAWRYNG